MAVLKAINYKSPVSVNRLIALAAPLLLLGGCLTVGNEFPSNVKWMEVGKTTRSQVKSQIGEPFRMGYDSGQLTYTYGFYRYSAFRPTRTKDLTVRFNENGTVASYSFASSFDEDKAAVEKGER